MTAIAGLRFQALFGERPFTDADRSLDRKSATDAFGSDPAGQPRELGARQQSVRLMFPAGDLAASTLQSVQPGGERARGIPQTVIRLDQGRLSVNRRVRSSVSNTTGSSVVARRSPVASR